MACDYLNFLETGGIFSWDDADGASILRFLQSLRNQWADSSMWLAVANFRPFLEFTPRTGTVQQNGIFQAERYQRELGG